MVGIVFKVDTGPETCSVLLEGHVLVEDNVAVYPNVRNAAFGQPVYIKAGATDGIMDCTVPNSGIVQVMGHCYYQNTGTTSNWMMKFKPSTDWYKL